MSTRLRTSVYSIFVLIAVAFAAHAQSLTGQLTGTVYDQNRAVIPQAVLTLTNQSSGDVRRTTSNGEGYFAIAAIPTGTYALTVQAQGFAKWVRQGLVFNPGDRRTLDDILLGATAVETVVDVTATPESLAPLDNGEKSVTITGAQMQNLSMVGRSAAELIKILPGMAPITGLDNAPGYDGSAIGINGNGDGGKQSALGNYSANGTRAEAMDVVADGAHVSDPGCNCATPVNINPDMVSEFKVLQSNYSAENSKGPVTLNAISKAGGKQFHGMAYSYFRHFALNSNDWRFNRTKTKRPESIYAFPGGNIGGPVVIPGTNFNKNRDKLFFFVGFEYFRQRLDTGLLQARVPTEAMRRGDFSDAAYLARLGSVQVNAQPTNRNGNTGIEGGRIPANLIDPIGQKLLNLFPLPNVAPDSNPFGYNYVNSLLLDQNMKQTLTRVDWSISERTKFYARYNLQTELQRFPVQLWSKSVGQVPYPTEIRGQNRSDSVSGSLTHVFSPTLTNEVIFGYTYINFPNSYADPTKIDKAALGIDLKGLYKNGYPFIPNVNIGGGQAFYQNNGGFEPILFATKYLATFSDNVTKVLSRHTLKGGIYWQYTINNQPSSGNTQGVVQTNIGTNTSTGNAIADLLIGRLNSYAEQNQNVLNNMGWRTFEFYVQDSWKAARGLTLDLGVRFYRMGVWRDREGIGFAVFDKSKFNAADAAAGKLPGVFYNEIDSSIPLSGAKSRPLYVGPRFGYAWNPFRDQKTIFRGGVGVMYYHDAQQPYASTINVAAGVRSTSLAANTLGGAPLTFAYINNASARDALITSFNALDASDRRMPVNYNYNFTIQRRLPYQMLLEVGYVGNQSKDQMNLGTPNINVVPLNNPGCLAAPNTTCDQFRIFPGYQNINLYSHVDYQRYNSLQMTLSRQTGRYGIFATYTFSKALGQLGAGQGAGSDIFDKRNHNYGILAYDRTHIFNTAYSIELPDFAERYLNSDSKILRGLIDGWQISGITQLASGYPLQANSFNFRLTGNLQQCRDIATCQPNAQGQFAGADLVTRYSVGSSNWINGTPNTSAQPFVVCDPRKGLGESQFANLSCFATPSPGNNGNYIFPYTKGPMFFNGDLSLFKNFKLAEKKKLQFRISANNFMNHPLHGLTTDNLRLEYVTDNPKSADPKLIPTQRTIEQFGTTLNPTTKEVLNKTGKRIITLAAKFY
ncbi:MAG: carboxypeptidase regulatory-like domain-containing protein, partial [Blastocatellia bacterium]